MNKIQVHQKEEGFTFPEVRPGNLVKVYISPTKRKTYSVYIVARPAVQTDKTKFVLVSLKCGTVWSNESLWKGLTPSEIEILQKGDSITLTVENL